MINWIILSWMHVVCLLAKLLIPAGARSYLQSERSPPAIDRPVETVPESETSFFGVATMYRAAPWAR
jgi:hypothetical protein